MSGPRSQVGLALGAAVLLSLFVGLLACPSSEEGLGPQDCVDGIDNDGDGTVDCADEGCIGGLDCGPDDDDATSDDDDSAPAADDDDSGAP